ncbi:SH3 domain-containing protein [Mobilitalea sibirica]|uniref:SH3 domain-containing protein n=1 Tax=Mobilitalea sibirica TaxID=1462919 RepID=A0A8J7L269_9FIRM|nr:SH3 domain-containing protein [Mobilitalea sibirica]MBH1940043.1 SH3 domain-containing protein [Mobilitalea sibirica]
MKKRLLGLLIMIAVFAFLGCDKPEQVTNFIPTPIPLLEEDDEQGTEDTKEKEGTEDSTEETGDSTKDEKDKPDFLGKPITKYVKLSEYDGILNIRKEPSTDSEIVGFLVHTEKIDVVSIENGWASFLYMDEICYVSEDFLVDKKPAYISPPTPTPSPTPTPIPDPNEAPPEI